MTNAPGFPHEGFPAPERDAEPTARLEVGGEFGSRPPAPADSGEATRLSPVGPSGPILHGEISAETAPGRIGPFRLGPLLGEGGMGRVYVAHDLELNRRMALKVLKHAAPEAVERLMQEARLQARVDHPSVGRIYRVGHSEQGPFIAMQFVDGQTLDQVGPELSLDQKVRIMVQVADAVHAAHRCGLIHRDLKPSNLMVERDAEGALRPYVLDFGLARDQEGPGLTQTGQTMGSPSYMAPEQIRGGRTDARTDVYGLGVTLFELLSGRTPFRGPDVMSIFFKVMEEEAPALSSIGNQIPEDLDSIVRSCLEKDPQRRYASAALLRDDLQRFLDGEPIQARKQTAFHRARKWAERNRALATTIAGASAILILLGGLLAESRWTAGRRAALAQELGRTLAEVEGSLQQAYLLPLHDLGPDKTEIRRRLQALEALGKQYGAWAEGPIAFALGRGRLSLEEYSQARQHLERALACGERGPDLSLHLGLAYANLYAEGKRATDPKDQPAQDLLARSLRDPALRHLALARAGTSTVPAAYLEAQLAHCEERWDAALVHLTEALKLRPYFFPARMLQGEVLLDQAAALARKGEYPRAEVCVAEGRKAFEACMDTARSYPPARRGFASTWRRALDLVWVSGKGDPSLLAERCRAAYSDSLRADSTYLQARADLALFHARLASVLARQGGDPFPDLALAQDAANAALGLDSEHTHSLRAAFFAFIQNASLKLEFGQDPRPDLEAGLHWGEALRGLQPGNQTILKDLGLSSCMLGRFLSVWDLEAEPSFRKAETLCREAADKRPAPLFHQVHGDVLVYSAEHEIARGGDGAKVLEQALAAYGKGLAQTPDNPGLLLGAAKAWSLLGTLRAKTGEDPSPDWNRAEEALGKVLEKNKQWVEALEGMADLGLRRAEAAPRPGHPVAKTLATALDFAVQASRAQPRGCTALLLQARIQLLDVPGRRRPAAAFGTALTLLQQAAKRAPMDPRPRLELARLVQERLKPGPSTGDPAALRKLALDALQEITAVNPRHRAALKLRGALGG